MAKTRTPYQICVRCIMDTSDTSIVFNEAGLCDYCVNFDTNIRPNWHDDERGEKKLAEIAEKIRQDGRKRSFDCIIGVSGGLDSSYVSLVTKRLGLRPLLFHVDGGWNTDQAVGNIEKIVNGLGLDLYTEVIDWEEMKDLQVAVLRSQIPQQDIPQDTAFFSALYKFARKERIKYSVTGGNYSTECCREPDEWGAFPGVDRTLIRDIHRRFGTIPLERFPIVDVFESKIYYRYVLGMRVVKPLDLTRYVKAEAEAELESLFGWQRFAHKHHESRLTRFLEDYWFPRKFGFDRRRAHLSSLIMTAQLSREDALARIEVPEFDDHFLEQEFEYVASKLELTVAELRQIFEGENRTMNDYRNKLPVIEMAGKVMVSLGLERRLYK
jgi:N-acetyl sugar amidotransferase